jgi:hypothetical protein
MIARRFSLLAVLLGSAALSLSAAGCSTPVEEGDYRLLRVAYADVQRDASCFAKGEVPKEIKDDKSSFRTGGTLVLYRGPDETYYLDAETVVMEGTRDGDTFTFSGESVDVDYQNGTPAVVILDTDHDGVADFMDDSIDADKDGIDDEYMDDLVDLDNDGEDDRFDDDEVDLDKDGLDDRFTEIEPEKDGDRVTTATTDTLSFKLSGSDVAGSSESSITVTCTGATCPEELPVCKTNVTFVGTLIEDVAVEHQL